MRVAMTVEQCWQPQPGGSARYIVELIHALQTRPDVSLRGFAARHERGPNPAFAPEAAVAHLRLPRTILYEAWSRFRFPPMIASGDADVIHATTWAIPPRTAPLVVTVHDLAFLRSPEHFTRRGIAFFTRALRTVRDHADHVIVPSQATADDCVAHGIGASRITVIPHGVRVFVPTPAAISQFRQRHGLSRPYLLWCGTLEPRKNLPQIIAAYRLLTQGSADMDLVLVGPVGWGETTGWLGATVTTAEREHIKVLGALDNTEIHAAYAGARGFVYPSLWEGFGMPVLEAMAHGVPVVTSRNTAMAEFVGNGGVLVDPTDPADVASAMRSIVDGDHDSYAQAARGQAARYSWDTSAAKHADVYREVSAS